MWLWGSSINVILADNIISRSQAVVLWPLDDGAVGPQPNFRVQVLNNQIKLGTVYRHARWQCAAPGSPPAIAGNLRPCETPHGLDPSVVPNVVGPMPGVTIQSSTYNSTRGGAFVNLPLTRGVVIKGNIFEADAGIEFGHVADVCAHSVHIFN
jgi:hypothetical protein